MEALATAVETAQFTIDIDASMKKAIQTVLNQLKGVLSVRETTPQGSMSEKEYYSMLDHSIEQAKIGETVAKEDGESMSDFLNRLICTE